MNTVEINTTDIVAFLKKPRAAFTKADIKRFIKAQGIRHVNFMYAGGDGRLKTLNFVINDSVTPSDAVQSFIDFATSAEAADLIRAAGAVPVV